MIPWRELSFGRKFTAHHFARYWFLRLLPFPTIRRFGAWVIGRFVIAQQGRRTTSASDSLRTTLGQIDTSGFASLAPLINSDQVEDVLAFLANEPAYDRGRELYVNSGPCDAPRAAYSAQTILRCPHVLRILNDPLVLDIAEGFLGCKPTIAALGLHWSYPTLQTPADVQTFHRDAEAWRLLNMFVYLTDVGIDGGPHRYVFGSQKTHGRLRLTAYSEDQVIEKYGVSNVHTVMGPRGTTFVENGWGIHEGHPPSGQRRLLLAVMYSVGPVPIYDYKRISLLQSHPYDKYVNRLMFA